MLSKGGKVDIGASPARIRAVMSAKLVGFAPEEHEQIKSLTNVEIIQK